MSSMKSLKLMPACRYRIYGSDSMGYASFEDITLDVIYLVPRLGGNGRQILNLIYTDAFGTTQQFNIEDSNFLLLESRQSPHALFYEKMVVVPKAYSNFPDMNILDHDCKHGQHDWVETDMLWTYCRGCNVTGTWSRKEFKFEKA